MKNCLGSALTDEDIDKILARGEEKTNLLSQKLQKDPFNFSIDESRSLYAFEGADYSNKQKKSQLQWLEARLNFFFLLFFKFFFYIFFCI